MKRNEKLGLLLLTGLLVLGCNFENKNKPSVNKEEFEKISAPEEIISIDEAKMEYDLYTKKRAELIEATEEIQEDGTKFQASRYGDYDIETVKKYIAYVEQEAKAAGVKVETLRFYFSTYPKNKEWNGEAKFKNAGQNSIFIVPTMKKGEVNYGFYIQTTEDGKKEAVFIRDYPGLVNNTQENTQERKKSYASFVPNSSTKPALFYNTESLIMNTIQMSPPPPRGSDFQ